MIHLRRTLPVDRVDVARFVPALPPLLQCFRDLKFNGDGVLMTADGRVLEGLRVTDGAHPRAHTSYSVVTRVESAANEGADERIVEPAEYAEGWQRITIASGRRLTTFTAYAGELVADDGRLFQVRGQEYGGDVELVVSLPDPRRPTRLELELRGYVDGPWPVRGPIRGSASIALDGFPPAHTGKPQLSATFRHRRVTGKMVVTIVPDSAWLATIEIQIRPRGLFRLAAPFSWLLRRQLQRELDKVDPREFDEFVNAAQERFGSTPDPSAMAAAAMDSLLAGIAETLPDEETP